MDFNHLNNDISNLLCVCCECHALVFHPEKYAEMIEWHEKRKERRRGNENQKIYINLK